MIRIRSKRDGFRRCGVRFSEQWTEYPDDRFSEAEVERLKAEPMLQVETLSDGVKAKRKE